MVVRLTISSLHIGQASLELAEVATLGADESPWSKDTLEAKSWLSDEGGVETPDSRERLLGEGETRWALDLWSWGDRAAGDNDFPLPRILPPPRVLLDMILSHGGTHEDGIGWWYQQQKRLEG
jgi:hypothetical protein